MYNNKVETGRTTVGSELDVQQLGLNWKYNNGVGTGRRTVGSEQDVNSWVGTGRTTVR